MNKLDMQNLAVRFERGLNMIEEGLDMMTAADQTSGNGMRVAGALVCDNVTDEIVKTDPLLCSLDAGLEYYTQCLRNQHPGAWIWYMCFIGL